MRSMWRAYAGHALEKELEAYTRHMEVIAKDKNHVEVICSKG